MTAHQPPFLDPTRFLGQLAWTWTGEDYILFGAPASPANVDPAAHATPNVAVRATSNHLIVLEVLSHIEIPISYTYDRGKVASSLPGNTNRLFCSEPALIAYAMA